MKVVILGGGPGGYVAALRAAILGADVTVIEKANLGGTCLNAGCIPTKSMLASTAVLSAIRDARRMGIKLDGTVQVDFPSVMERKNKVVTQLVQGIEMLFQARGVKKLHGIGTLGADGVLTVAGDNGSVSTIDYDRLILATGSVPVVPKMFPFDGKIVITSNEALQLKELPASVIIVGGGVIGCELGQFFAKCGTTVTLVEALPHLLPNEDPEIATALVRSFRKDKITVYTGKRVDICRVKEQGAIVTLDDGKTVTAEKLLICIGRQPNAAGLALEELGIKTENGKIVTNSFMQTTHPGIYAIGDLVNSPMLAHVASHEGIVAVEHICGKQTTVSYRGIPRCVYTSPEIACVGATEYECVREGRPYKTGVYQFAGLGKAKAVGKTDGFVKVVVDDHDVLIGASIVGEHATELLSELTLAVELQLTAEQVGHVIHPHPTMCEAIMEALHQVHGVCVHSY